MHLTDVCMSSSGTGNVSPQRSAVSSISSEDALATTPTSLAYRMRRPVVIAEGAEPSLPRALLGLYLCTQGHVPVCAFLGKDKGQLSPSMALQHGVGNMVVYYLRDAVRIAVRLFHQCHVVASSWNTGTKC